MPRMVTTAAGGSSWSANSTSPFEPWRRASLATSHTAVARRLWASEPSWRSPARTEDWGAMPDDGTTESAAPTAGRTGSVGVLVVDDSPVYRRGMARAVRLHSGLELVGEAGGGEAALEAIERLRPDVVLLDLRM